MAELKPCPFCGSSNVEACFADEYGDIFTVICCACGSCGAVKITEQEAIEAWNKRSK